MDKAGSIRDMEATSIGAGSVRVDFVASTPPNHNAFDRYTAIVDLDTARAMAILLIRAIERAEVDEARAKPKRKK